MIVTLDGFTRWQDGKNGINRNYLGRITISVNISTNS